MGIDPRKSCLGLQSQGTLPLKTSTMAFGTHQRPPVSFMKGIFPQDQGNPPTSTLIGLIMWEPRIVDIWYYIPLCTIFPQKSNGVVFRAKLRHSNPVLKSITHFEGRLLSHSVLQSMAATRRPFEDPNHLAL
ncbi:hypothetical protein O181_082637 [Austropuccinia psidii MF-1]|uniref:Uncharacterized protein n=1 Tax=Austropuccinia psidii MF-1 TaxID=1389203 RepID=A0A9Q3IJE3_9BASI|nr:hypothetical protein [Austropuccinia psidii MF-1]